MGTVFKFRDDKVGKTMVSTAGVFAGPVEIVMLKSLPLRVIWWCVEQGNDGWRERRCQQLVHFEACEC